MKKTPKFRKGSDRKITTLEKLQTFQREAVILEDAIPADVLPPTTPGTLVYTSGENDFYVIRLTKNAYSVAGECATYGVLVKQQDMWEATYYGTELDEFGVPHKKTGIGYRENFPSTQEFQEFLWQILNMSPINLASLKGDKGDPGQNGTNGIDGQPGPQGPPGVCPECPPPGLYGPPPGGTITDPPPGTPPVTPGTPPGVTIPPGPTDTPTPTPPLNTLYTIDPGNCNENILSFFGTNIEHNPDLWQAFKNLASLNNLHIFTLDLDLEFKATLISSAQNLGMPVGATLVDAEIRYEYESIEIAFISVNFTVLNLNVIDAKWFQPIISLRDAGNNNLKENVLIATSRYNFVFDHNISGDDDVLVPLHLQLAASYAKNTDSPYTNKVTLKNLDQAPKLNLNCSLISPNPLQLFFFSSLTDPFIKLNLCKFTYFYNTSIADFHIIRGATGPGNTFGDAPCGDFGPSGGGSTRTWIDFGFVSNGTQVFLGGSAIPSTVRALLIGARTNGTISVYLRADNTGEALATYNANVAAGFISSGSTTFICNYTDTPDLVKMQWLAPVVGSNHFGAAEFWGFHQPSGFNSVSVMCYGYQLTNGQVHIISETEYNSSKCSSWAYPAYSALPGPPA